jgi:hypothetical protein
MKARFSGEDQGDVNEGSQRHKREHQWQHDAGLDDRGTPN